MFKDHLDIKEYHQMEAINAGLLITAAKNCRRAERERAKPKQRIERRPPPRPKTDLKKGESRRPTNR